MFYCNIILPVPLDGQFTYAVPTSLAQKLQVGMRVLVPFGKTKTYVGVVSAYPVTVNEAATDEKGSKIVYKEIKSLLDDTPSLLPQQLRLWQWISDYYLAPIGDVYKAAFPTGLKELEKYKPKTEVYIRLADKFKSNQSLQLILDALKRSRRQQEVLLCYYVWQRQMPFPSFLLPPFCARLHAKN